LRQSHRCRLFYIFVLVTVALVAHLWRTFHCFSLMPLLFLSFLPCMISRYMSVQWKYRVLRQSNCCIIFYTTVLPLVAHLWRTFQLQCNSEPILAVRVGWYNFLFFCKYTIKAYYVLYSIENPVYIFKSTLKCGNKTTYLLKMI
jgi:hypothetical protein